MNSIKDIIPNYKYNSYVYAKFLKIDKIGLIHAKTCVTPIFFYILYNNIFYKYRINLNNINELEYLEFINEKKCNIEYTFLKNKYKISEKKGLTIIDE